MNRSILTLAKAAYVLAVAAILTFGFSQVSAASVDWPECDIAASGEIGTCPPFTPGTCHDECVRIYGTFGDCRPSDNAGCCLCAY